MPKPIDIVSAEVYRMMKVERGLMDVAANKDDLWLAAYHQARAAVLQEAYWNVRKVLVGHE